MFIDFCGTDGTGKSTAYEAFCDTLEATGARVLRTREVGNPHIKVCSRLREIILDPTNNMDGRAMELVFSAMRIENKRFYDSVKDCYDYIVSDRGWLCHLAYTDHNVNPDFTERLYLEMIEPISYLPDRVYLFQVNAEEAARRRNNRGEVVDAIELKGDIFQARVAESYRKWANIYRDDIDIRTIDTSGSRESVAKQLIGEAIGLLRDA